MSNKQKCSIKYSFYIIESFCLFFLLCGIISIFLYHFRDSIMKINPVIFSYLKKCYRFCNEYILNAYSFVIPALPTFAFFVKKYKFICSLFKYEDAEEKLLNIKLIWFFLRHYKFAISIVMLICFLCSLILIGCVYCSLVPNIVIRLFYISVMAFLDYSIMIIYFSNSIIEIKISFLSKYILSCPDSDFSKYYWYWEIEMKKVLKKNNLYSNNLECCYFVMQKEAKIQSLEKENVRYVFPLINYIKEDVEYKNVLYLIFLHNTYTNNPLNQYDLMLIHNFTLSALKNSIDPQILLRNDPLKQYCKEKKGNKSYILITMFFITWYQNINKEISEETYSNYRDEISKFIREQSMPVGIPVNIEVMRDYFEKIVNDQDQKIFELYDPNAIYEMIK